MGSNSSPWLCYSQNDAPFGYSLSVWWVVVSRSRRVSRANQRPVGLARAGRARPGSDELGGENWGDATRSAGRGGGGRDGFLGKTLDSLDSHSHIWECRQQEMTFQETGLEGGQIRFNIFVG